MFAFGAPSAPVANWGVLGFPEASSSYNFIYSRLPSTAESGPSSPSRATLVPQQRVFCWSEGGAQQESTGLGLRSQHARASEPATSSLGKQHYISYQGFRDQPGPPNTTQFPEFPDFGRERNHNGITIRRHAPDVSQVQVGSQHGRLSNSWSRSLPDCSLTSAL